MDKETIIRQAKMELARRGFFFYCHLKSPEFYREDRPYIVDLCNQLQDFVESDDEVMVINLPPRHGKSRTAGNLVEWLLGKNQKKKIMTGSYNETLSTSFSKSVRNTIQEVKADEQRIIYSDIFRGVSIKRGDGAANLWSLEGGYNNYLATSPTGTATGFGCDLMIIDDLIKSYAEACNDLVKEKHWEWFTGTMLSRLEEGGKIIIIMTRWATNDLSGRALEHYRLRQARVRHITMKAVQDDGSMLCEEILSREAYQNKIAAMGRDVAEANYQQSPIDIKGKLYTSFKTYTEIPRDDDGNALFHGIFSYADTADAGSDYLCQIIWGDYMGAAYVLDVLYTQKPMEETEDMAALALSKYGVNRARVESNNGGSGWARNVARITKEKYKNRKTVVKWFHQSKNKMARILSNAPWIMENVYFPQDWSTRFPEYHDAMTKYQRSAKNAHDDAQDATTGLAETMCKTKRG